MSEIYWLTRIGTIGSVCVTIVIIGIVIASCGLIYFPLILEYIDDSEAFKKFLKKWCGVAIFVWIVGILGTMFVPTKKELLMIYGLGSTIDYIKSNDKAKQLPDKAVEALEKFLEQTTENEKK